MPEIISIIYFLCFPIKTINEWLSRGAGYQRFKLCHPKNEKKKTFDSIVFSIRGIVDWIVTCKTWTCEQFQSSVSRPDQNSNHTL